MVATRALSLSTTKTVRTVKNECAHSLLGHIPRLAQSVKSSKQMQTGPLFTRLLPMVAFAFHPRNILVATSAFSVLFLSFECLDIAFLPNTD